MKAEERKLLLKDLCARLPFQLKVKVDDDKEPYTLLAINANNKICVIGQQFDEVYATSRVEIERIKPYLRTRLSMTKEEDCEYYSYCDRESDLYIDTAESFDYLNKIHVDYRGLIDIGLAIKVTEENNPYK